MSGKSFCTLLLGSTLSMHAFAGTIVPGDLVVTQVASGLSGATGMAAPNDGSGRIFITENTSGTGRIRIVDAGGNILSPAYYTRSITGGAGDEQGLLGIAMDPDFATNGTFYITYTAPGSDPELGSEPDQVLMRLVADDPAANVFSGTQTVVLRIPDPYWNHNGGNIQFGPDGYLYWGMGDGGSGGDPNDFAQNLWKKTVGGKSYYLLGKMMRLDVRNPVVTAPANQCGATAGQPAEYSIPSDNPYAGATDKCGEIWLHGLRNPWRWSFDRFTGDLVIGDVGQNQYEEIDFRAAGSTETGNYGWNLCEGFHYYDASGSGTTCPATTGTVAPVLEYAHSGGLCSVTGGYIYRGPVTSMNGLYVFGDACTGGIKVADPSAGWAYEQVSGTSYGIYSFGEDPAGNVYVLRSNVLYRLDSSSPIPTHVVTPDAGPGGSLSPSLPVTVNDGDSVAFTVTPNAGYAIDDVTGCGGSLSGSTYTTAPVHADCTVTATFVATVTYTVTPTAGPGGTIDPSAAQIVEPGETVAFTVTPDPGYLLDDVTGCGGALAGSVYTTAPVHADCTVTATFAEDDTIFVDGFDG